MARNPQTKGGRIYIRWDGLALQAHGTVTIKPTSVTRESEPSLDGEMCVTIKAALAEASVSFWNTVGDDPLLLFEAGYANITLVSRDEEKSYVFNDAAIVGEPEFDPTTGKWTDMMIRCSHRNFQILEDATGV